MTTCQICGREIKAHPLIAHHGYKRPHLQGYQTRSCFGARYRPYEEAHDALDAYIPKLETWLEQARLAAEKWLREPPDTIIYRRRDAWRAKIGEPIIYTRPENFDAEQHFNAGSYRPSTYEGQYTAHAHDLRQNVTGLTADLKMMRERLAAWKSTSVRRRNGGGGIRRRA